MGNIMRQPAGVMAGGCWLIELLPALHTEQNRRTAGGPAATPARLSKTFHLYWMMWSQDSRKATTERDGPSRYIFIHPEYTADSQPEVSSS